MSPKELTSRQSDILEYIYDYARECGYPPTIRQIGDQFGIKSPNGVADHLKALERKGEIRLHANTARGIELLNPPERGLPIVGRVAAGAPILAAENIDDYLTLERIFPIDGKCFALTVKGDSMVEEGIHDGDIVVVRPQQTAKNGDIVVAILDEEATVKKFYKEKSAIRLEPANKKYSPIISKNVEVRGLVIGVIRKMG